jgi:hypothetical protein
MEIEPRPWMGLRPVCSGVVVGRGGDRWNVQPAAGTVVGVDP